MPLAKDLVSEKWKSVNLAFSRQSLHFDEDDLANPILQSWRKQIHDHVLEFLNPGTSLLELNAGTGIDALFFAKKGYRVLATDLSDGMVRQIRKKMALNPEAELTCRQMSFEDLDQLKPQTFDYVFSNFGGLNCTRHLSRVTNGLSSLLRPGGYVTCVVMPPFCPWEITWLLRGKWNDGLRRFTAGGAQAHLEGESFPTYYHSLAHLKNAFGNSFRLVKAEGLGLFSAPPSAVSFNRKFPRIQRFLEKLDGIVNEHFPFNRWGDHIISTFQKN